VSHASKSPVRVPPEFHALAVEVRLIARLLNDYLRESDGSVPGSPACIELAAQPGFADSNVIDPVLHVAVRGHQSLIAAVDHLLAVAACIDTEDVALATMTLLRPIVTAAGMCSYLFDPQIGVRERLRRGFNLELDSVREQLNGINQKELPKLWEDLASTRSRYLAWGNSHGYGQQTGKERYGARRFWLTDGDAVDRAPSDMKLAKDVLLGLGDGGIGHSVYRFTSAFIHTQAHSFSMFLPADLQYDPQTPNVVPLGLSLVDLTTWLLVTISAVHKAAARTAWYFGWDTAEWVSTVHPIMNGWSRSVAAEA
jgi:hypothetical protein